MALVIKKGDTRTAIKATLKNPSGSPVNLTGSSVTFIMVKSGAQLVNRSADIVDAQNGRVNFVFVAGETEVTGVVRAEFKVEYPDGSKETFPNSGYISITFEPALA
jgi:hypothetical protein